MSATGRNLEGQERRADDFYATPAWVTRAIVPHLRLGDSFDPCCGEGAILDALREEFAADFLGMEIDVDRAAEARRKGYNVFGGDALGRTQWPSATLLVTNPPYSLAAEFIQRALERYRKSIDCAFLLRINYLGSQKRAAFHREHPSDVFVLPRRPSFTGKGTDATEYAWFVWGPGRGGRWSILDVP